MEKTELCRFHFHRFSGAKRRCERFHCTFAHNLGELKPMLDQWNRGRHWAIAKGRSKPFDSEEWVLEAVRALEGETSDSRSRSPVPKAKISPRRSLRSPSLRRRSRSPRGRSLQTQPQPVKPQTPSASCATTNSGSSGGGQRFAKLRPQARR